MHLPTVRAVAGSTKHVYYDQECERLRYNAALPFERAARGTSTMVRAVAIIVIIIIHNSHCHTDLYDQPIGCQPNRPQIELWSSSWIIIIIRHPHHRCFPHQVATCAPSWINSGYRVTDVEGNRLTQEGQVASGWLSQNGR